MLTARYMTSVKNVAAIMNKIVEGTAPDKFTQSHLKGIGFKSSYDSALIPMLKDLGFLTDDGTPTPRYHAYRDKSRSKAVMAEALREAYAGLFHINANPTKSDREAITGKFRSEHNVSDSVAKKQAATFYAFLDLADLDANQDSDESESSHDEAPTDSDNAQTIDVPTSNLNVGLRYNVEIHLPATKDADVYNAIFKSLKEHLLDG